MRTTSRRLMGPALALVGACSVGCNRSGDAAKTPARAGADGRMPVESTSRTTARATGTAAAGAGNASRGATKAPVRNRTGAPRVLFLGTSLTAGQGLDDPAADAYPAVLQTMADSAGIPAYIVNAGLSGESSAGALRRADWLLQERPDVVVIETGANDGLRGLDPDSTAANLRALIAKVRAAHPAASILLVQMEAPTNLGARYTNAFHALFARVATEEKVTLLPFLLDGVAGIPKLNQPDGIHPTAEGARLAARNIWPGLRAALRR